MASYQPLNDDEHRGEKRSRSYKDCDGRKTSEYSPYVPTASFAPACNNTTNSEYDQQQSRYYRDQPNGDSFQNKLMQNQHQQQRNYYHTYHRGVEGNPYQPGGSRPPVDRDYSLPFQYSKLQEQPKQQPLLDIHPPFSECESSSHIINQESSRKLELSDSIVNEEVTPAAVQQKEEAVVLEEKETKKPVPIMVGKRRGGRVLPTGVVKKQRVESQNQGRSDAWSQYMAEVRRYKEQSCEEERKNRPLVK